MKETEHDTTTWNLLNANIKDKSIHNSIEPKGLSFKCMSHHDWSKYSDLHCSDY